MPIADIFLVSRWWIMLFVIGIMFLPLNTLLFKNLTDKGYLFAKILGLIFTPYLVFVLGITRVAQFNQLTIILSLLFFSIINFILLVKKKEILSLIKGSWKVFLWEEVLFIAALTFWTYIRAHQPDIHGLEKYEDFGFINSIIRSEYFPPLDMWFTPFSINYYYFGHFITALLSKLSGLPSYYTFNLMLATVFAFSFTGAFSISFNLLSAFFSTFKTKVYSNMWLIIGGFMSGFLVTLGGNLHTIYSFFMSYPNENPVPFWQLAFSPQTFPNAYWYPNATRFIYNTIHEFPPYSFVVSDLHAHVLDLSFVFFAIAIIFTILISKKINFFKIVFLSFLLSIMYMTSAWDGPIYFSLSLIVISYFILKPHLSPFKIKNLKFMIYTLTKYALILGIGFIIFSTPFNLHFKPFASGIGILCAPKFLTDIGKWGPFLFEADHCQRSPLWQLIILYGFFYFWVISYAIYNYTHRKIKGFVLTSSDIFVFVLSILSTLLIVIPEFIYIKDIYPAHYRANTMFKFIFQAFIMLSICSSYIIVRLFVNRKNFMQNAWGRIYWLIGITILFMVSIYPYFSINSYFGNLKQYSGLNGTSYLGNLYSNDYEAIKWLNENIAGQPIILEAQGDSYSDFARVSTNTGLPTVLGWTVHEWLWRGSYDIPAPRITEINKAYESEDLEETKKILKKYNVSLVFIGNLEKQKYKNLNENKFYSLGKVIFQKGDTKIFKIN